MNLINDFQFALLNKYYSVNPQAPVVENRMALDHIFPKKFSSKIKDKFVVDFGCGHGGDTETMAKWGAKLSLGIEIRDELVQNNLKRVNLPNCSFATVIPENLKSKADIIISVDAFEHFDRPDLMLAMMYEILRPGGEAYISFGPTWYHARGGHTFSVFPWSHLLLSEKSLMRWRNQFYHDGATRFHEVAGGLNKHPISHFEKIFQNSPFEIVEFNCHPIRGQKWLQKIIGRELATSMVSIHLKKPV